MEEALCQDEVKTLEKEKMVVRELDISDDIIQTAKLFILQYTEKHILK